MRTVRLAASGQLRRFVEGSAYSDPEIAVTVHAPSRSTTVTPSPLPSGVKTVPVKPRTAASLVGERDGRLDANELDVLISRAADQQNRLEDLRRQAVAGSLVAMAGMTH